MILVPTLTDGVVTLRAHTDDDIEGAFEQCIDPVSQQWTTVPVPYTRDDAKRFIRDAMPGGWATDQEWAFAFSAVDPATGEARYAGTISLRNERDGRAEIAYGSHPWVRGTGTVERALRLLLDWGFAPSSEGGRDLNTVIWLANEGNWASRKLAWRLGFSFDGTVRKWLPQRGALLNAWVGVLLREDERAPRHQWFDAPRIVGENVVLRPHKPGDAPRIAEACRDERSRQWLRRLPEPYREADANAFMESRIGAMAGGTCVHWAMADPATDDLIGVINIFQIEAGRDGEVGYWTHPDARGRGVMTEACRLVVRHGFVPAEDGGLGLRRLTACAAVDNVASRHVIEACGFTQFGIERRGVEIGGGALADLACYDLLAEEFRPAQPPSASRTRQD
ncbi:MAG: putative GCN5-related N-acetyltransferase [Marmoricola sp.]|jgi:RimJ/RimL family protein N-acetyltransferase|nr:putative GCN5-related N-acetyltransferase [Marmoricola sp.]